MKKYYLYIVIASLIMLFNSPANSQVHFDMHINIGNQPVWGPVGYDYVEYYYMPDIEVYYNVPLGVYYYYDGRMWVNGPSLPPMYRNYDIYRMHKVVINDREPWRYHDKYKKKYWKFRNRHDQRIIRDSYDEKYYVIKDHPRHKEWKEMGKHDNGLHKGQQKNRDSYDNGRGNGKQDSWNDNRYNNDKVKGNSNGRNESNGRGNGRGKHGK